MTVDSRKLGSLLLNYLRNNSYEETIENLDPFTNYKIQVAAENAAGIGAFSSKSVLTFEDKPGTRPFGLDYKNISSTSVNITWNEPEEPNGVITHYTVGLGSPDAGIDKHDTKTNQTFLILENLDKYSLYEVRKNRYKLLN